MKIIVRIALSLACWLGALLGGWVVQLIASGLGYEISFVEAMTLAVVVTLYDRYSIDRR